MMVLLRLFIWCPLVSGASLFADNRLYLTEQVKRSIQAVHRLGVLHRDAEPRNILWNAEVGQAMVIDFERAEVLKPRAMLGIILLN